MPEILIARSWRKGCREPNYELKRDGEELSASCDSTQSHGQRASLTDLVPITWY